MGLSHAVITGEDLLAAPALRLDPRHHRLMLQVRPFFDSLVEASELGQMVSAFSNGPNLPSGAYAIDEGEDGETAVLYASVAAFSMFTFRPENAIPLESDAAGEILGLKGAIQDLSLTASDVAITRSGVPGIAWPGALGTESQVVIPSGFVIRGRVVESADPVAVAAILNHPCWRVLTAAYAAGKAQFNLSQELLGAVPFPRISQACALEIRAEYENLLSEIDTALAMVADIRGRCDEILASRLAGWGLAPTMKTLQSVDISGASALAAPHFRIDNRWHGVAGRELRGLLASTSTVPMGSLLAEGPFKRSQPEIVRDEESTETMPYVVATVALQDGQVVKALGKPSTSSSVAVLPLSRGDLLVAMDGVGSLGKAAIFASDDEATVDSHVSVSRTLKAKVAPALACYLNSSFGRVQTETLMTGATGQTGLSVDELASLPIPKPVVDDADAIGTAYEEGAAEYARLGDRVRRMLSASSARVTAILQRDGALDLPPELSAFTDEETLLELLQSLYPRVGR